MSAIKPAGFWKRFAAVLLDCLVIAVPFWILSWLLSLGTQMFSSAAAAMFTAQFISCAVLVVYTVAFWASHWQATPGKRIMKIYVASADGKRLGVRTALSRYLALNIAALLYLVIGTLMVPVPTLPPDMPAAERQQFEELRHKVEQHEELTEDEQQMLNSMMRAVMQSTMTRMGISQEDIQRLTIIQQRQEMHQPLSPEEQQLADRVAEKVSANAMKGAGMGLIALVYALLTALMIGLTRKKTGPHDIVCKTRVYCGTPETPVRI